MNLRGKILAAAVALAAPAVAAEAQAQAQAQAQAEGDAVVYRTVKGDNLYTLARRYLLRTTDFAVVQRINRVRDPYRVPVGAALRIPRTLLRYEPISAKVVAFRGEVRIRRFGAERLAERDGAVGEGDEIATGPDGFVTLGLPDGTVVSLPSQSQIVVRRLRRLLINGGVERLFALEAGRARAAVTPMPDRKDDFRLSTPLATSAVRGTEFRMSYAPGPGRATIEVLEGAVDVAAGPEAQQVTAGFGAVATPAGAGAAVALLPAPALVRPGEAQDEGRLAFGIRPMEGAAAYRLQIASDAGFLDVVEETTSVVADVTAPAVPDGTWFVRVSAIDPNGLEGQAATYGFQRRLNRTETALERRRAGGYREYLFRWRAEGRGQHRFRFQLSREGTELPLVDEAGLTEERFVVTDLPPGAYRWRVLTQQFVDGAVIEKWSQAEQLIISADQ